MQFVQPEDAKQALETLERFLVDSPITDDGKLFLRHGSEESIDMIRAFCIARDCAEVTQEPIYQSMLFKAERIPESVRLGQAQRAVYEKQHLLMDWYERGAPHIAVRDTDLNCAANVLRVYQRLLEAS